MTQYIRMTIATGVVDLTTLCANPPDIKDAQGNQAFECKGWRWLAVAPNVSVNSWQYEGDFPTTVVTNATTISRILVSYSLASWKAKRIEEIRREQWSRAASSFPLGQMIYSIVVACRIIYKRANGGALTAGELSTLNAIITGFTGTVEPIGVAADNAVTAINAAATHADVETAYASVAWP